MIGDGYPESLVINSGIEDVDDMVAFDKAILSAQHVQGILAFFEFSGSERRMDASEANICEGFFIVGEKSIRRFAGRELLLDDEPLCFIFHEIRGREITLYNRDF